MTVDEYIQEYNTLITQCHKDINKSRWKCIGRIALLLLIEIALIVGGVLVNELTTLQYTPIVIWCGVIALVPFAYKISKEALDAHDRCKAINELICIGANWGITLVKEMQEKEGNDNDTNITV